MFQITPKAEATEPIRNISCQLCKESFADHETLIQHYNSSHSGPWYNSRSACRICQNIYKDYQSLLAHEFKVHGIGEPPRKCRYCDERFLTSYKVKKHVKQKHPEHFNGIGMKLEWMLKKSLFKVCNGIGSLFMVHLKSCIYETFLKARKSILANCINSYWLINK